jgi:predicted amidohydrolase
MSITKHASSLGARWIVFHENSICDYTSKVAELAEPVPNGMCTRKVSEMSRSLNCYVSFGLIEKSGERHYISQVFVGPDGYFYHYRKTWLCRDPKNVGYRNEWVYFDPGKDQSCSKWTVLRQPASFVLTVKLHAALNEQQSLRPKLSSTQTTEPPYQDSVSSEKERERLMRQCL